LRLFVENSLMQFDLPHFINNLKLLGIFNPIPVGCDPQGSRQNVPLERSFCHSPKVLGQYKVLGVRYKVLGSDQVNNIYLTADVMIFSLSIPDRHVARGGWEVVR